MGDGLFTDTLPIEEAIALWLDGGMTYEEELQLMGTISQDSILSAVMDSLDNVDSAYEDMVESGFDLPPELVFDFDLPTIEQVGIFDEVLKPSEVIDSELPNDYASGYEYPLEEECEEVNDNSICEGDSESVNLLQTDWDSLIL